MKPSSRPPVPGPRALGAYARLKVSPDLLAPRIRHLVRQLAAVRSGCQYCALSARHQALIDGVPVGALDGVTDHAGGVEFSEPERAALAFADAVTQFAEDRGGLPEGVLARTRRHFSEAQIQLLVGIVAGEHFFDAGSGRLGADARLPLDPSTRLER
jgi:alkylhydroperoxidase family enzyme